MKGLYVDCGRTVKTSRYLFHSSIKWNSLHTLSLSNFNQHDLSYFLNRTPQLSDLNLQGSADGIRRTRVSSVSLRVLDVRRLGEVKEIVIEKARRDLIVLKPSSGDTVNFQ